MTKKTQIVCIEPLVLAKGENKFKVLLEVVSDEPDAKQPGYQKVMSRGSINGDSQLHVEYGFNYPVGHEGVYNPLYLSLDAPMGGPFDVDTEPKFKITKA